jgi:tetratricopeptide (TPR) repeat protein
VLLLTVALAVECTDDCTALGRAQTDPAQSALYWASGCGAGDPTSCVALSEAYLYGRGVPNNLARGKELQEEAIVLYEGRCTAGDGDACALVADYRETASWDVLACASDQVKSCALLAETQPRYLEKACRLGDRRSCTRWERSMWEEALAAEDRSRAADLYELLHQLFPHSEHDPLALWNLANAQSDLGRIKPAIATWELFLTKYPDHEKAPVALERIAQGHESLNQLEQAKAARQQLKLSYPDHAAAPAD